MPQTMATSLRSRSEAGAAVPPRRRDHPERVLDRDELRPGPLHVELRPAEAREDQGLPAGDEVTPVELGGDLHGEPAPLHRLGGVGRVGRRGEQVPAQADEHLDVPSCMARRSNRRCRARAAEGGVKPNSRPRSSRKPWLIRSQMPIVRSPCTFEWPRTQQAPAPGRPMWPPSSRRLSTAETLSTPLRCCVRPIAQHTIIRSARAAILPGGAGSSSTRTPLASTISPQSVASGIGGQRVEAFGVPVDEGPVDHLAGTAVLFLEDGLDDPLEQGDVAVHPHRQVQVRQLDPRTGSSTG